MTWSYYFLISVRKKRSGLMGWFTTSLKRGKVFVWLDNVQRMSDSFDNDTYVWSITGLLTSTLHKSARICTVHYAHILKVMSFVNVDGTFPKVMYTILVYLFCGYNTGNRAGYSRANCNLDPLELEYWRDFRTRGTPHKGLHYALFKISKFWFLSQPQSFL